MNQKDRLKCKLLAWASLSVPHWAHTLEFDPDAGDSSIVFF